ncbi:LADA_0C09736g1_1 [Lachancea dasiensis]|uniref:GPI-anchored wall transfer protein n=1 Tax=Lachancea dasiensis TaxID=1072105 RepID=A0A1G4J0Y6_9SACH|nr:LADA_0C09736g1_1 [Lachancea dasiensis]
MADLRQRKEDFVTGLTGGTIEEINWVTSVAICSYICWNLVRSSIKNGIANSVVDFFFNWCGILLALTTYANNPGALNVLLLGPCLAIWILMKKSSRASMTKFEPRETRHSRQDDSNTTLVKRPFITVYRGSMMVITVLAILAVDFQIFPRRFAKVETWGTSIMDLGVGSFVFSNGVVSSRSILKNELSVHKAKSLKKAISALRSSGSILFLGLLRLFFVKNLEYQEHVSEYGVHWNFFITLALVPLVMVPVDQLSPYVPRIVVALTMSVIYELFLVFKKGFITFLVSGPRNTFLEANREGIFSFIGYCAIFLWGQTTGFYVLGNIPTKNNLYKPSSQPISKLKTPSGWDKLTSTSPLSGLLIWSFISILLSQIAFAWDPLNISRRFANLPYVLWVVSYNISALTLYCIVDVFFGNTPKNYQTPPSLEALNSNGLLLFLVANVSTGLVNMAMPTIDASPLQAFLVLLAYSIFLALTAGVMFKKRIFIKL